MWLFGGDASTVDRRFAAADAETRVAFVADLWAARGWETSVEGDCVVATDHPRWPDRTVHVASRPGAAVPDAADVTVTTGGAPAGVRALTPADVARLARYAVDRDRAAALTRRHLDVDPLRFADETPARGRRADALLLAVVAVVLSAAVVGAVGGGGAPVRPPDSAPTTTPTPGDAPATPASVETSIPVNALVAPGVSARGVVDARALGEAHRRAVADESYALMLTYREYHNHSRLTAPAVRTERVTVANASHYRVETGGWGNVTRDPLTVADADVYADGSHQFVRETTDGYVIYERHPVYARTLADSGRGSSVGRSSAHAFAWRTGRYVRWYLAGGTTTVDGTTTRDGREYYRLTVVGNDYPGVVNFSAVALVAPDGFVPELRASYDLPDSDVSVVFTLSFDSLDDRPSPPPWYDAARNATHPVLGENESGPPPKTTRYTPTETAATDSPREWLDPADYRLYRAR